MKVVTAWQDSGTLLPGVAIGAGALAIVLFAFDVLTIAAAGVVSGGLYHVWGYGTIGPLGRHAGLGLLAGLLYALPTLYKGEYLLPRLLTETDQLRGIVGNWLLAFVLLLVTAFLTKTSADFSRGALAVFLLLGLLTAVAARKAATRAVRLARSRGYIAGRRVLLIGLVAEIERMIQRVCDPRSSVHLCGCIPVDVDGTQALAADWPRIVERARAMRPDDIVILSERADSPNVEAVARELLMLPSAVHVSVGETLGRFQNARLSRLGSAPTICLTDTPLGPMQSLAKRAFDVAVAAVALAMLAPVFDGIALLIRLSSPGPVLFRQRRRGFNQEEFRIWKFRTMTTIEDGVHVRQAVAGDARITRVGAWLRRLNLDELPQLVNVLRGEMSIVGPRPHAVSHDEHYQARISAYPRRLNVKPGLTGWAQIHGFRGPTQDEADMAARVEHDLYYIDNWSMMLDFYIIVMTLLSPKAYRNAV
jgi:Undecaprenyl-phosphate glucose phosphotransferase